MKSTMGLCLLAVTMAWAVGAQQDPTKPVLRPGISVKMPISNQAIEMRDADEEDATVVSITADGNLFLGTRPEQLSSLGKLTVETVYVKADARVPYQRVLAVLDVLRGHTVVLLTAAPSNGEAKTIMWPYGVRVKLGAQ